MIESFQAIEDFTAAVETLSTERAERVRRRFSEARLDPEVLERRADALRLTQHSDGPAYDGYLWDFLAAKSVMSETAIWQAVDDVADVYAMWDRHSTDHVRVPSSFRLPRGTVLRADPRTLRRGVHHLPEDLYVFDDSFAWAAALTHEWVDGGRFCLWSGPMPASGTREDG